MFRYHKDKEAVDENCRIILLYFFPLQYMLQPLIRTILCSGTPFTVEKVSP